MCVTFLELLIHVRAVQDVRVPQTVTKDEKFCGCVVRLTVVVPHLQDVKALLGADADANNRIGR